MWGMFLCATRGLQRMIIKMSNPDILSKTGRDLLPEETVEYFKEIRSINYYNVLNKTYIVALNEKENELDRRSAALDQREAEIEKKSRLPLKERLELGPLRLLKKSVEWLVKQPFVPDIVRKLLDKALNGEDLSQNKGLEFLERQRIKEIAL